MQLLGDNGFHVTSYQFKQTRAFVKLKKHFVKTGNTLQV